MMKIKFNSLIIFFKGLVVFIAIAIFWGCSTQTDALPNRLFHQLNTKYNGLFYAEKYLAEGVDKIKKSHIDDYSGIITINQLGSAKNAQSAQGSLDKAIEKSTLAIQKHSMDIDGEEKNNLIDHNYMIIGQAQFYKKDYAQAITTFNYITRKSINEEIKTEALIWATRCHQESNNTESLRKNIILLEEEYFLKKHQDALLDEIQAELAIFEGYYVEAKQNLIKVIAKTNDVGKRIRAHYMVGQISIILKDAEGALKHFNSVIKKNPEYEMVFNAKLNRAKTYTINKNNFSEFTKDLYKMLADSKNEEYLDQIYFVLAGLELANTDTISAIKSLELSSQKSIYNNEQKKSSHYLLAKLFWNRKKYVKAYNHCDTAYQFSSPEKPQHQEIKNMLRGAKKIANYYNIIFTNDSIITLAQLPEEERNQIIDRYIAELREQELAEKTIEQESLGQPFNSYEFNRQAQNNMNITASGGWYFYNSSAMSLGFSEFLSRWGNRKLEDNWRRKNKNQLVSDEDVEAGNPPSGPTEQEKYNREYYIKQLPQNQEEQEAVLLKIESAYYDLAGVFREDLEDYAQAKKTYNDLLGRFPETDYKQLIYFDLYGVFTLMGDTISALNFLEKIKKEYPKNEQLLILNGEKPIDPKRELDEMVYEEAYDIYLKRDKNSCKKLNQILQENPASIFLSEIELLSIFCEAQYIDKKNFIENLKLFNNNCTNPSLSSKIDTILLVIQGEINNDPHETYKNDFNSPHLFFILIDDIGVNLPETQSLISKFNNSNYKLDSLATTNLLLNKNDQILSVRDFKNKAEALAYYELIQESSITEKLFLNPHIKPLVISTNNYTQLLKEKNIKDYMKYFNEIYLLN